MSYDKKLLWWISGLLSFSSLLVMAVWAKDNTAFVEHLSHYHLDPERVREDLEKEADRKSENTRIQKQWSNELMEPWANGRSGDRGGYEGTCGPPDRDK